MYRFMEYCYLILRILFVAFLIGLVTWILDHLAEVGTWTAKYNKAMVSEFDKR